MSGNRKYLMLGASLLVILIIGFIVVRGNDVSSLENIDPPDTSSSDDSTGPLFKLVDLRGTEYSLTDYKETPVLVHFMAVSCGGEYSTLNDNQLKQMKILCNTLCSEDKVKIFTVLISTCETTDLTQLYNMYNVTWIMGNDYQDNKLDVVDTFSEYEPEDGMIILLDQDHVVKDVIKGGISAKALVDEISKLEG